MASNAQLKLLTDFLNIRDVIKLSQGVTPPTRLQNRT